MQSPIVRVCSLLGLLGCTACTVNAQQRFVDATTSAGIWGQYEYPIGPLNPARMRAGGAVGDFDRDGDQDLFVLGGGATPDRLFINDGSGYFKDKAAEWGVARSHLGSGVAVADVNADGWLDIYVTSFGPLEALEQPGHHLLYINNQGKGFTNEASERGVSLTAPGQHDGFSASFGDYDLDGDLDLAVGGWMQGSGGNRLFENDGAGYFKDRTQALFGNDLMGVNGFVPRFQDMDGDRYPELLIVGDFYTSQYYRNERDGTFRNITPLTGTALDSNGMGNAIADFNGDGRPDWFVTSIDTSLFPTRSGNMLYINQGNHVYTETSVAAGVNMGGWGWGADAQDFDHDGKVDLLWTNGWLGVPVWETDPTFVCFNDGTAHFTTPAQSQSGMMHTGQGRGLLTFDADNDGDRDIVLFNLAQPTLMYRNETRQQSNTAWLTVFLETTGDSTLAPDGVGALITATVDGTTQLRWISASSNYLAQSEMSAHFGLGSADSIDELRIEWPNGKQTVLNDVAPNQILTITSPRAAPLPRPQFLPFAQPFTRPWSHSPQK